MSTVDVLEADVEVTTTKEQEASGFPFEGTPDSLSTSDNTPAIQQEEEANTDIQFTVEHSALLKSLSHVQTVVERRGSIPILSNVKFDANDGSLTLTATDMEIAISETIEANVTVPGSITVPAHTLHDIVRKLPEGSQISLDSTIGTKGSITLSAANCKFTLSILPSQNFPVVDAGNFSHSFTLSAKDASYLIDKSRFAISTEETRYYLNGIYLHSYESNDLQTLRAVATDGHRLARIEISLPEGASGIAGVIIPRKTVVELKKLLDDSDEETLSVQLSDTKVQFNYGNAILLSKLIDGNFPDYEKVIPDGNDKIMEVNAQQLSNAVDRVSTIASDKTRTIKLSLNSGELVLSANSPESGTAKEVLEITYSADNIETGFNSRYLLDMLAQMDGDSVQFVLANGSTPAIVRDASDVGALYVIMPMRV